MFFSPAGAKYLFFRVYLMDYHPSWKLYFWEVWLSIFWKIFPTIFIMVCPSASNTSAVIWSDPKAFLFFSTPMVLLYYDQLFRRGYCVFEGILKWFSSFCKSSFVCLGNSLTDFILHNHIFFPWFFFQDHEPFWTSCRRDYF